MKRILQNVIARLTELRDRDGLSSMEVEQLESATRLLAVTKDSSSAGNLNTYCITTGLNQLIVRAPARPSNDMIRRRLLLDEDELIAVRQINIVTWNE